MNRTFSEVTCSGGNNRGAVNGKISFGHGQRRFFHHFPSPLFVIIAGNQGGIIRLQLSWKMVSFILGLVAIAISALSVTSFFAISLLHENNSMSSELVPLREKLRASIEETASIRRESDQQQTLLSLRVTQLELDNILQSEAVIKEKAKSHPSSGGLLATQQGEDSIAGHGDNDYSSADGSVMTSSDNGGDVTYQSAHKIFLRTGDKVKRMMSPVLRPGEKVKIIVRGPGDEVQEVQNDSHESYAEGAQDTDRHRRESHDAKKTGHEAMMNFAGVTDVADFDFGAPH